MSKKTTNAACCRNCRRSLAVKYGVCWCEARNRIVDADTERLNAARKSDECQMFDRK